MEFESSCSINDSKTHTYWTWKQFIWHQVLHQALYLNKQYGIMKNNHSTKAKNLIKINYVSGDPYFGEDTANVRATMEGRCRASHS